VSTPDRCLRVSVIIPTLNEAETIGGCLDALAGQGADEVIIVDAASPDGTAARAAGRCARVLASPCGRAIQQNRGARVATGDVLLFLHADCRPEPGSIGRLRDFVRRNPKVPAGCFRMRVVGGSPLYRMIDAAAHLRAGVMGVPYGDQGVFVARSAFARVGGFPEVRLMEDVQIALRLRRLGRIALLPMRLDVSDRRWRHQGIIRQTFRNWALTLLAALGVPPDRLARYYPPIRSSSAGGP
jgi:rSAM/selenodomain-associated transferase 2